jgi:hypothetical protein
MVEDLLENAGSQSNVDLQWLRPESAEIMRQVALVKTRIGERITQLNYNLLYVYSRYQDFDFMLADGFQGLAEDFRRTHRAKAASASPGTDDGVTL